jgi:hypothetical protein
MGTTQSRHRHQWRKSSFSSDTGPDCIECATLGPANWSKSSYSSDTGGECVECAALGPAAVAVRDSKRPDGPHLTVPAPGFAAFVRAAADDTLA